MFLAESVFADVELTGVGTAVFLILLAAIVIAAIAVNVVPRVLHKWEIEYTTRDITYGAVCLALAFALSWATLFKLPQGGAVTAASLAPVYIYCYYFGFRKGAALSAAYMLLQFFQFPYIVSAWSAFFDYIVPYFSLCVVGLFGFKPQKYAAFVKRNKDDGKSGAKSAVKKWTFTVAGHWGIFAGAALHMIIRYASQAFSGMLFYSTAGVSFGANLAYSLSYNSFGLVDSAIAVAATFMLLSARSFNMFMTATFDDKRALKSVAATSSATEDAAEQVAPQQSGAAETPCGTEQLQTDTRE